MLAQALHFGYHHPAMTGVKMLMGRVYPERRLKAKAQLCDEVLISLPAQNVTYKSFGFQTRLFLLFSTGFSAALCLEAWAMEHTHQKCCVRHLGWLGDISVIFVLLHNTYNVRLVSPPTADLVTCEAAAAAGHSG